MTTTVNIHEAKTHLSRLLERAVAGEDIVIAKAGKPYAKLVPLTPPVRAPRVPGALKGQIHPCFYEPLPPEELDAWEGK